MYMARRTNHIMPSAPYVCYPNSINGEMESGMYYCFSTLHAFLPLYVVSTDL